MKHRFLSCVAALAVVWVLPSPGAWGRQAQPPRAEAIYVSGNIYTVDADRPRAEAIAVSGGRILAVGSNAQVRALAGQATQTFDLGGRTVLPGLIDCHGHVAGLGAFGLGRIDLSRTPNYEAAIAAVVAQAQQTPKGQWVLGGRWDHESWPGKALPTHAALSAATPDHPVWLRRVDGHAALANAAAMALADITRETPDPPGGEIIRDSAGNATGVFVDNAMRLVQRVASGEDATPEALILKAQEMCMAAGLVGVNDAGVSPADVQTYRALEQDGRLKVRVYVMVSAFHAMRYFEEHPLYKGPRVTVRSAKLYMDGAMGSRGAWLLSPYADRPTNDHGDPYTGLSVAEPSFVQEITEHALARGYQVCTHAIGDRGNREVLNAYERAMKKTPRLDTRFRIEHAQLLALEDIPRFAALGVIPSMQATHCTSDMRWVDARVGPERARGAYAWASLLRSGARIAGGSDFPVESHNPFLGLYASITRQNAKGEPPGGWRPDERMTREEALRSFTLDAAYSSFEEDSRGSLTPGKQADFIVIDRDIMTCEPREVPEARVLRTVIAGETVYAAGGEN